MNQLEIVRLEIKALRQTVLVNLMGAEAWDSERLHECAKHLQEALGALNGVKTVV
jgi:hypothetical protein